MLASAGSPVLQGEVADEPQRHFGFVNGMFDIAEGFLRPGGGFYERGQLAQAG